MPNHVQNKIRFICSDERRNEIFKAIQNDEEGLGTIDFNKVIPMPESLNIEAGSRTDKAISLYLTYVNPDAKHYGRTDDKISENEMYDLYTKVKRHSGCNPNVSESEIEKILKFNKEKELLDLGQKAVNNIVNYKAANWYDWAIANWGTKWNAYCNSPFSEGLDFQTAWSAPHPVLEEIAYRYPDVKIEHRWADEDLGNNCGEAVYYDGKKIEEYYPEVRRDAMEFALEVWDDDAESCGLTLNATETDYINDEMAEYELVNFRGNVALFANERLTMNDIPKGLYCNDIRGSDDDPGELTTLERNVTVNHAGTLITNAPIDYGENESINLSNEDEINFLGEKATLREYLENNFDLEEGLAFD